MQKYEITVKNFVDMLCSGNIDTQFIEYLRQLSGVYDIENSKMASIFNGIFTDKMKITRDSQNNNKGNIDNIYIPSDKVELGKEYVFTSVDTTHHKPRYIVLFGNKMIINSFKQLVLVVTTEIFKRDSSLEDKISKVRFPEIKNKSTEKDGMVLIEGTNLKVNTWIGSEHAIRIIKKLFDIADISYDNLLICFDK